MSKVLSKTSEPKTCCQMKIGHWFMSSFGRFNRGIMKMPLGWRLWLMLLLSVNVIVPLFNLGRLETKVVLGMFAGSMVIFTILTGVFGFTRILGLGHILWLPLLVFLWMRLGQIPADDFYGVWIRVLMGLNGVSLVIDAMDVIRYIRGDRKETVRF